MDNDYPGEEVLESAWKLTVEAGLGAIPLEQLGLDRRSPVLQELEDRGLVIISKGLFSLTEAGTSSARSIIRRHRLAERLLSDVIDLKGAEVDQSACRLEHILYTELEEKICTLLGHPTLCPHGQPIPPGACCTDGRDSDLRLIATVADLKAGQEGNVAYLHSEDGARIQKLMALGVFPGAALRLLQRRPSFVFQVGHAQIAVDKEIARSIFVRF
ncbi:MAG: metal-dependent transcriptional regulator [Spirochaetaceae bacterium]|nr:MAG: metal-dependent transcriptional regulator [Spirochaetaceae bacterium]